MSHPPPGQEACVPDPAHGSGSCRPHPRLISEASRPMPLGQGARAGGEGAGTAAPAPTMELQDRSWRVPDLGEPGTEAAAGCPGARPVLGTRWTPRRWARQAVCRLLPPEPDKFPAQVPGTDGRMDRQMHTLPAVPAGSGKHACGPSSAPTQQDQVPGESAHPQKGAGRCNLQRG